MIIDPVILRASSFFTAGAVLWSILFIVCFFSVLTVTSDYHHDFDTSEEVMMWIINFLFFCLAVTNWIGFYVTQQGG